MPFADNNGTRIHYHVEGEGTPLLLQHGFTSSIKNWYTNGYVEPLKQDYKLILVDARGHGESDKPHDPAQYDLKLRVGLTQVISGYASKAKGLLEAVHAKRHYRSGAASPWVN